MGRASLYFTYIQGSGILRILLVCKSTSLSRTEPWLSGSHGNAAVVRLV